MTSASELFYSRRLRSLRSPEPALLSASTELDRDRDRDRDREHHHHRLPRRQHRHRLHFHDCGSPRHLSRSEAAHGGRHLCDRGVAPQSICCCLEGLLFLLNLALVGGSFDVVFKDFNGTIESNLGSNSNSNSNGEIPSRNSGLRLTANDRLPGAVLQARARLLARLRGISLTGSRQNTSSSGISRDEFVVSDDFRVTDLEDWETDALEGLEPGSSFFDSTFRAEQSSSLLDQKEKKPPGLTWEAISILQREVFKDTGGGSSVASKVSLECCICLDKFRQGDLLIRLACGHRFHPECLNPWVRTCGDCPYCRSRIVVNPGGEKRLTGATYAC